jgi:glycosyltransferase involved in cell wall biosynthesis
MNERKKIICVIDDLCSGGAQRQLVNLAIEFVSKGHSVKFLIYNDKLYYKEVLNGYGIEVVLLLRKNFLSRVFSFWKYLRFAKPDVVISYLAVPSFISTIATFPLKKWKLIVGERSSNPEILKSKKSKMLRKFFYRADFIVANSDSNLNLVKQILPQIPESKFKVIYNLIDIEKFSVLSDFEYRKDGKFHIVIPASYRKLKNLIGLINATNNLELEYKNTLIIDWFGDKSVESHSDNVLEEAESLIINFNLQSVIRLNNVNNKIQEKMKQADAIGLFSFFEGLPNSICEGMACSKPIIATNVSDVSIFVHDCIGGKICEADDIDSITSAIKYMMDLSTIELLNMGKHNRMIATQLFDKNINVENYISLF